MCLRTATRANIQTVFLVRKNDVKRGCAMLLPLFNILLCILLNQIMFAHLLNSFLFPLQLPLDIQKRTIEAILEKVTRSNLCLICDVQFADKAAVEHHYLNVHHTGTFACKVFGCMKVEKTNGDLRMHHCLWHPELVASRKLLPVSDQREHLLFCVDLMFSPLNVAKPNDFHV